MIGPLSVRLVLAVWWDRAGRSNLDGFVAGVLVSSAIHACAMGWW